jgi:hypothetical protein
VFTRDQQADALIQAHLAWNKREGLAEIHEGSRASIAHGSTDRRYLAGMGLMPQNESRRRYPNQTPRMRLAGQRDSAGNWIGTSQKVRVIHADGRVELRDADSFRRQKTPTRRAIVTPGETSHRVTAGDLAPAMVDEA